MSSSFEQTVELASRHARYRLEDAASTPTDLRNWVEVHRDNQPQFLFGYRTTTATELIDQWAAQYLEPDTIVSVKDAWVALSTTNPVTGKQWGPGDVTTIREAHDGEANGWVSEALCVVAANRQGEMVVHVYPYQRADERITWTDLSDDAHTVATTVYLKDAGTLFGTMVDHPVAEYGPSSAAREQGQADLDLEALQRFTTTVDANDGSPDDFIVAATPGSIRHQRLLEFLNIDAVVDAAELKAARRAV